MQSKKLSLVGASIVSTAAGLGSLFAGFISTVLIARTLGAEGTGLTAFGLWLVITACVISDRGIPHIVLRYIARQGHAEAPRSAFVRAVYEKYIWLFLLFLAGFASYSFWSGYVQGNSEWTFWLITGLLFLVYYHSQLSHSADIGRADYVGPARRVLLGSVLQIPATIVGAIFFGPAGAMLGYVTRHLPQAFNIRRYLNKTPGERDRITQQIVSYGRNQWISSSVAVVVRTRIEFLFIGFFFSLTELGYFAAGMTFASLVLQLALSMCSGLTPRFGTMRDQNETRELEVRYRRALGWLSLVLMPICFGGAGLMPELLPLVLGSEFAPAVPIGIILLIAAYPMSIVLVPLSVMQASEKDGTILKFNISIAVILITSNFMLTPFFGGQGAAWIKCLVGFGAVAFVLRYSYVVLRLQAGIGNLFRIGLSAAASGYAAYLAATTLHGLTGVLFGTALGAVVYLAGIRLTRSLPFDDAASLSGSLQRLLPSPVTRPALMMLTFLRAPS